MFILKECEAPPNSSYKEHLEVLKESWGQYMDEDTKQDYQGWTCSYQRMWTTLIQVKTAMLMPEDLTVIGMAVESSHSEQPGALSDRTLHILRGSSPLTR
jgi:hypothetical protein